jgi:hypothetical protein
VIDGLEQALVVKVGVERSAESGYYVPLDLAGLRLRGKLRGLGVAVVVRRRR